MSKKSAQKPQKLKKTLPNTKDKKPQQATSTVTEPKSKAGILHRFTLESFKSRRQRRRVDRNISRTKMDHSFRIFNRSVGMLRRHWEIFGGITIIFVILNLLLVGTDFIGSGQLEDLKDQASGADSSTGEALGATGTGVLLYGGLLEGGAGLVTGAASAYQTILLTIFSLVYIWALRQLYAEKAIRIRDAMYNATYPLVQMLLVVAMIFFQLMPAFVGLFLFNTFISGGVAVTTMQQVLAATLSGLFVYWSVYMLCASLFALYIVTLPEMTPLVALRTAKRLVKFRRGTVLRKLIYLPLVLVPITVIIVAPIAFFFTSAAAVIFFIVMALCVPLVHSYMYTLYRELIKQ